MTEAELTASRERWDQFARGQQEMAARFKDMPMKFAPVSKVKPLKPVIGRRLRFEYRQAHHSCYWCGAVFAGAIYATLDHLVSRAKGGTHEASNMVLACFNCNNRKKDADPHEFLPDASELIDQILTAIKSGAASPDALPQFPRGAVVTVFAKFFLTIFPHGYGQ